MGSQILSQSVNLPPSKTCNKTAKNFKLKQIMDILKSSLTPFLFYTPCYPKYRKFSIFYQILFHYATDSDFQQIRICSKLRIYSNSEKLSKQLLWRLWHFACLPRKGKKLTFCDHIGSEDFQMYHECVYCRFSRLLQPWLKAVDSDKRLLSKLGSTRSASLVVPTNFWFTGCDNWNLTSTALEEVYETYIPQ